MDTLRVCSKYVEVHSVIGFMTAPRQLITQNKYYSLLNSAYTLKVAKGKYYPEA